MSDDPLFAIVSNQGRRTVALWDYLDSATEEAVETETYAWIKAVRNARVGGLRFRERFTYRGDSLWWFAEIYLHKRRVIFGLLRALRAMEALIRIERPTRLVCVRAGRLVRHVTAQVSAREGIDYHGGRATAGAWVARVGESLGMLGESYLYAASGRRQRPAAGPCGSPGGIAAVVHAAFASRDGSDDVYVGPLLRELRDRPLKMPFTVLGVGSPEKYRGRSLSRRFADALARRAAAPALPMLADCYSGAGPREWLGVWRTRRTTLDALSASTDLRQAALVSGCDFWPVVRSELKGIAYLQFPWSARSMDEAAAALDALRPAAVITYAEAGGIGRALLLEARRRGVPVAAMQHGFISRHWLNYLHEPDEVEPSPANLRDAGFPFPTRMLVYDEFAARHLSDAGHPADCLVVTGSPRLDALVAAARRMTQADVMAARTAVGAGPDTRLVLLVSKYNPQRRAAFAALMDAVDAMPGVHLAIRPHPGELAGIYETLAAGRHAISIAPAHASLGVLLATAHLLVTVNSTAAIEAMALDVPALSLNLPNYLSPFVESGALQGTRDVAEIRDAVYRLLFNDRVRTELADARRRVMQQYRMEPDGGAARRAADVVIQLARTPQASGMSASKTATPQTLSNA